MGATPSADRLGFPFWRTPGTPPGENTDAKLLREWLHRDAWAWYSACRALGRGVPEKLAGRATWSQGVPDAKVALQCAGIESGRCVGPVGHGVRPVLIAAKLDVPSGVGVRLPWWTFVRLGLQARAIPQEVAGGRRANRGLLLRRWPSWGSLSQRRVRGRRWNAGATWTHVRSKSCSAS